jgi:hypothetical protein
MMRPVTSCHTMIRLANSSPCARRRAEARRYRDAGHRRGLLATRYRVSPTVSTMSRLSRYATPFDEQSHNIYGNPI